MHSEEKISQILDEKRPSLSRADKNLLWGTLKPKLKTTSILSPYVFTFNLKNHMAPLALALILMLGSTGIVAASESARPGDTLFLVDQTVEDIRLALASNDSKTRLEGQFAAERLHELSSILNESIHSTVSTTTSDIASSTATATTPDAERINQAIALTLNYLTRSNISEDAKDTLFGELAFLLEGVPVKLNSDQIRSENEDHTRISIESDEEDEGRVEIRDTENRIRIQEKDGEIRIDTTGDWKDHDYEDDDYEELISTTTSSTISLDAEAHVYTDTTIVKLEINDRKTTFTTTAQTEPGIVEEIVSRYGLDRAQVEANFDFKIENKPSKPTPVVDTVAPDTTDNTATDDNSDEKDEQDRTENKDQEEENDEEDRNEDTHEEREHKDRDDVVVTPTDSPLIQE